MTQQTIEVEGLPEGWKAVAYRKPIFGEYYFYNDDIQQGKTGSGQFLIVEKIQPRRIVLEETGDDNNDMPAVQHFNLGETVVNLHSHKIWKKVKE